jgi:hypothetical protein
LKELLQALGGGGRAHVEERAHGIEYCSRARCGVDLNFILDKSDDDDG